MGYALLGLGMVLIAVLGMALVGAAVALADSAEMKAEEEELERIREERREVDVIEFRRRTHALRRGEDNAA